MSRRALGRGLRALMPDAGPRGARFEAREVAVASIVPNRFQPRMNVEDKAIEELAESIRQHGVLEPIIVRPLDKGYELVAGERRWRAAAAAGLEHVPAVVRELTDKEAIAVALIENLQREQLDPIEEARGFRQLMELFNATQEEVAQEVGRSRSSVANSLRLLTLEEPIQEYLRRGELTVGHGKALLGLPPGERRVAVARQVVQKGLSVRGTEELVKRQLQTGSTRARTRRTDPGVRELEQRLESALGTRVRVSRRARGGGRIEIEYYSDEDMMRILDVLGRDTGGWW